jgi:hypothetical protein
MLSAVISARHSYSAMPLARQLTHQRSVHLGPLVLEAAPFKSLAPTADRDRPVSRRSEPSSRTALTGEQPDPWDLVQPQDAMSRHRGITKPDFRLCSTRWSCSQAPLCLYTLWWVSIPPEGTFGRLRYLLGGDRPSQTAHLARSPARMTVRG